MKKVPKIRGYDWSGLVIAGGAAVMISGVLPYGTRGGPFLVERLTVPGSIIVGLIMVLVGIIPMLGKRFGSRAAMIGGGTGAVLLATLDIWLRFDNLSDLNVQGAEVGFGLWIALGGGILAAVGSIGSIVQGSRGHAEGAPEVALGVRTAGTVPPPPPPSSPAPESAPLVLRRVPPEGMVGATEPDPSAQIVSTLPGGVVLQLLAVEGDWAHVRAESGWEGWVAADKLEPLERVPV